MALFAVNNVWVSSPSAFVNYVLENGIRGERELIVRPPLVAEETAIELTQLVSAIREGSLPNFKSLLNEVGTDINQVDDTTGATPLIAACVHRQSEMVKRLLKKKADPFLCDRQKWTPLHSSVWNMDVKCIKTFLSASGAPLVNERDLYGRTPLMIAAFKGNIDIVKILIKSKSNLYSKDNNGSSIIHWSVASKNVQLLQMLHKQYFTDIAYWDEPDTEGATPLHYATLFGSVEVVAFLLIKGCNPLLTTTLSRDTLTDGFSPIHWSCVNGSSQTVQCLLEYNIDMLSIESSNGMQPLHVAACTGNEILCSKLIQEGADVCCKDSFGQTPLHWSSKQGHIECATFISTKLSTHRLNDVSHDHHYTSLHLSSKNGHSEVVEVLLSGGADRDMPSQDEFSNCAIHLAAIEGHVKVLEVLINHGALVDLLRGSDVRTPLHVSAQFGMTSCCQLLIENNAQLNIRDGSIERLTPLDLALLNGHTSTAEYLISRGASTGGGKIHNSATLIQRSWKRYVRRRRISVNRDWAARRIQYHFRQWMNRKRSIKLRAIRERRRHFAARTIQRKWTEYITVRKSMEDSYRALKAKLNNQQIATQIILTELQTHTSNVQLPPPIHSHSKRRLHIKPTPLFPTQSLLFDNSPKNPLFKSVPRVKAISDKSIYNSTNEKLPMQRQQQQHPPPPYKKILSTSALPQTQNTSSNRNINWHSSIPELPPLSPSHCLVVTDDSVDSSRIQRRSIDKKSPAAINVRKRTQRDLNLSKNKISNTDQELLVNHAKRYDQLHQVMELLKQAKDTQRKSSDVVASDYTELKGQIQSALEEAIRLRTDTKELCNRISTQ